MKIYQNKINFLWLVVGSILVKFLGIFRESIIAYYIGSSAEFAMFNSLRSIIDILMGFVIGMPVIEGLMLPKYVPLYKINSNISFFNLSKKVTWLVYSVFILTTICLFLFTQYKSYLFNGSLIVLLILFGAHFALYVSNIFYLTLQKVIGNFKSYSVQSLSTSLIAFICLIILIRSLGMYAILVSLIISPTISTFFLKKKINLNPDSTGQAPLLSLNELDWSAFFAMNHVAFVGFSGKFLISLENSNNVNYYQYSFVIIYSFMMIMVANLSSITLYNSSLDNHKSLLKSLKFPLLMNTISVIFLVIIFYFCGDIIIKLLFERGKFTHQDTNNTFQFLKYFVFPFIFFSYTQLLLQPILAKKEILLFKRTIKLITIILISSLLGCITYGMISKDFLTSLITFLYLPSITIFICLISTIIIYIRNGNIK